MLIRAARPDDAEATAQVHVASWAAADPARWGAGVGGEGRTIDFVGESIPEVRYAKQL